MWRLFALPPLTTKWVERRAPPPCQGHGNALPPLVASCYNSSPLFFLSFCCKGGKGWQRNRQARNLGKGLSGPLPPFAPVTGGGVSKLLLQMAVGLAEWHAVDGVPLPHLTYLGAEIGQGAALSHPTPLKGCWFSGRDPLPPTSDHIQPDLGLIQPAIK